MLMFDLVVCGDGPAVGDACEFAFGHARLRRQWPHRLWQVVDGASCAALGREALARGSALDDSALVLLLSHGHWLMTDGTAQEMVNALGGAQIALCHGGAYPPPAAATPYHTLRGLERYGEELALSAAAGSVPLQSMEALPNVPALVTRLGTLRALDRGSAALGCWPGGSFAHDFSNYQQGARPEVLRLIPPDVRRVLDVGGGEGGFLESLKAAYGCETHLSEFSTQACARARSRVDHCWPGDLLQQQWVGLPSAGKRAFDCITVLDALEHTESPQRWLQRLRELLAPGGCLVGSVPNVGHWSVVADLLEGHWDYCPVGIHCVTHLRFFTRRTLTDLLHWCGFSVDCIEPVIQPCPENWRSQWLASPGLDTARGELDTYAFLFRARVAA